MGIFDSICKPNSAGTPSRLPRTVNSFDEPMRQVKSALRLEGLPSGTAVRRITAETVESGLEQARQGELLADVTTLNNSLRQLAGLSEADRADRLLKRMTRDFGVRPTDQSREIVAFAHVKAGHADAALRMLGTVEEISPLGQFVVWKLMREALDQHDSEMAWSLFEGLRAKTLPVPEVCSVILAHCGKQDRIELALKTYQELQAQGLAPNELTHSALIYAAAKRRAFYPKAVALFKEMETNRMPIDIRVYNNLLMGASKVGDLHTGLELWNRVQEEGSPAINQHTVSNMLWTLAAVETAENKISRRRYHYDLEPAELKATAEAVVRHAEQSGVVINPHILTAHLAVLANHNFIEEAEALFWTRLSEHRPAPSSFEILLKMYDAALNYSKTEHLVAFSKEHHVSLGFEAWRAAIRTAALTSHLPQSIEWLKEMVAAGHRPRVDDLRALHLRLCENEKWELRRVMGELCLPPAQIPSNPYTNWRKRSVAIAELLAKVYGKAAPSLATKLE